MFLSADSRRVPVVIVEELKVFYSLICSYLYSKYSRYVFKDM